MNEASDPFPQSIQLSAIGLLAAFLLGGAFTRVPHSVAASLIGVSLSVICAAVGSGRRAWWLSLSLFFIAGAGVVLNAGGTHSGVGWFAMCVLAFLAIPVLGGRMGGVFGTCAAAVIAYKMFDNGFDAGWMPWFFGVLVSALGAGAIVHERCLSAQLREAQEDLAERSKAEERARIARDLHDVIAHSLTVSLLHLSAARLAVEHDTPAEAAEALREAERLGRESLDEVRSIVGLMRSDSPDRGSFAPTPGLDRISELVERFRSAGVRISLETGTPAANIPATVGTTAYRIAQEALTNAAKHAPGAAVAVALHEHDQILVLTVDSDGAPRNGTGHGLGSMQERAQAVGGKVVAAPADLPGGVRGWRVTAELPTETWFRAA